MHNDNGYAGFLAGEGLTDAEVWEIMDRLPTPISHPQISSTFYLAASVIHGIGLFARRDIIVGEVFPVAEGAVRYWPARYINHSNTPNIVMDFTISDGVYTVAMRHVYPLTADDEITVNYTDNLRKSRDVLLANPKSLWSSPFAGNLPA